MTPMEIISCRNWPPERSWRGPIGGLPLPLPLVERTGIEGTTEIGFHKGAFQLSGNCTCGI